MCVLYLSVGSKIRPRTFGYVVMCSAVLFIVMSMWFACSDGSRVNRVQVVLSGFSARLFCFVQTKSVCRYVCLYFFTSLVLVCLEVMVISTAYAMT